MLNASGSRRLRRRGGIWLLVASDWLLVVRTGGPVLCRFSQLPATSNQQPATDSSSSHRNGVQDPIELLSREQTTSHDDLVHAAPGLEGLLRDGRRMLVSDHR